MREYRKEPGASTSRSADKTTNPEHIAPILDRLLNEILGATEDGAGHLVGPITDAQHEHSILLDKLAAIEDVYEVERQDEEARAHAQDQRTQRWKREESAITAAERVWSVGRDAKGTSAERYLNLRGVELSENGSIRFIPRLLHRPSGERHPALIAAVTRWPSIEIIGVSRTWIQPDGSGKAAVDPPRMALGLLAGGAVQLADAGPSLIIGEGVESVLSLMRATGLPGWAVLGTSGFKTLVLPPPSQVPGIVIGADHDEAGLVAANKAAKRWRVEGYDVRIAVPPTPGQDFNDLLRAKDAA